MRVEIGGAPSGPLAGVRVLDLSTIVSGPMCAMILGDHGADVIKVESPSGDTARWLGGAGPPGLSGTFAQLNRNKRSVVLDLKSDAALQALRKLAGGADVVVENFRSGVADRLGVGYSALSRENPQLVYVAISGYGPDGPYAAQPAYDMVIQGLAGFAKILGSEDEPKLIANLVADKTTGLTAAYAVMAALYAREKTGRGQKVDVAMIDAFAAFVWADAYGSRTWGVPPPPAQVDGDGIYRAWKTADGHVALLIVEDRHFEAMCHAIEREDLLGDERYATLAARVANWRDLDKVIEAAVRTRPTVELVERAHRFGMPMQPITDVDSFLADPQVRANEIAFELEGPEGKTMRVFKSPPRYASTPSNVRRTPPTLGQHTGEVLREVGLNDDEISRIGGSGR